MAVASYRNMCDGPDELTYQGIAMPVGNLLSIAAESEAASLYRLGMASPYVTGPARRFEFLRGR